MADEQVSSTVLLIDSAELVRRAIRQLLEAAFRVVGDYPHRPGAVALAAAARPDLIVIDPETEDGLSFEIIGDLVAASPQSRILILTAARDPRVCTHSVMMGAAGVVSKREPPAVLFTALRKLTAGEVWLDRMRTAIVFSEVARRQRSEALVDTKVRTLTRRERDIVQGICDGLRNKDVAARFFISEATVRNHITSILNKLGLSSRVELMRFAFDTGLIEIGRSQSRS